MLIQKTKKKQKISKQKPIPNALQCYYINIFTTHPTLTTTVSTINNKLIELQHYLKSVFLQLKKNYNLIKKKKNQIHEKYSCKRTTTTKNENETKTKTKTNRNGMAIEKINIKSKPLHFPVYCLLSTTNYKQKTVETIIL